MKISAVFKQTQIYFSPILFYKKNHLFCLLFLQHWVKLVINPDWALALLSYLCSLSLRAGCGRGAELTGLERLCVFCVISPNIVVESSQYSIHWTRASPSLEEFCPRDRGTQIRFDLILWKHKFHWRGIYMLFHLCWIELVQSITDFFI